MSACHAIGCEKRLPGNFLMCPFHWRLVPSVVRKVWRWACADHDATRGREGSGEAYIENYHEVRRIVQAIERGVPA